MCWSSVVGPLQHGLELASAARLVRRAIRRLIDRDVPNFLLLNEFFFGMTTNFENLQWTVMDRCVFSNIRALHICTFKWAVIDRCVFSNIGCGLQL